MSKEIEIEKKYKVKKIPEDLEKYEHKEIEQSYLNKGGSPIRLRRFTKGNVNTYIFSKKVRSEEESLKCKETNVELPESVYNDLIEAREGRIIRKTRYLIPLNDGLKVELDIFHDFFEGVCIAEIEYESVEQANNYKIPNWLGEELTASDKLTNAYMATKAKDINEYIDYMQENNRI